MMCVHLIHKEPKVPNHIEIWKCSKFQIHTGIKYKLVIYQGP